MSDEKESQGPQHLETLPQATSNNRKPYTNALGAIFTCCGSALIHRQLRTRSLDSVPIFSCLAPIISIINTREITVGAEVILLALQYHLTIKLFAIPRWREIYLPWVCGIAIAALLIGALIMEELGTLLLEVYANIIAALIVGCLIVDGVSD